MPTINRKPHKMQTQMICVQPHESAKYYNNKLWQLTRKMYIQQHPLCEDCLEHNIITPAEHVHHIIPFMSANTDAERWRLLSSYNNLRSLCIKCHHKVHQKLRNTPAI